MLNLVSFIQCGNKLEILSGLKIFKLFEFIKYILFS